jgi:hypothetical protein
MAFKMEQSIKIKTQLKDIYTATITPALKQKNRIGSEFHLINKKTNTKISLYDTNHRILPAPPASERHE